MYQCVNIFWIGSHFMKFGLQHPIFSFDYSNHNTSQIVDSLKNLVTRAENIGFDSFWVMDHFHQIPFIGKPEEPMLEGWTTLSVLAGITIDKFHPHLQL